MRRAFLLVVAWMLALRPPAGAQTLTIPIETQIRPVVGKTLFAQLFANFFSESDGTTYVQTGDIPAMWLRDSAAQTMPYIRFVHNYPELSKTFYGVVERDAKNITNNPYAEAFSADYHVWEDKWEIDSLSWPVVLISCAMPTPTIAEFSRRPCIARCRRSCRCSNASSSTRRAATSRGRTRCRRAISTIPAPASSGALSAPRTIR
ncbi:MAG: glycoside hydrolase family 125 protein [Candidatus Cybelea sp.]